MTKRGPMPTPIPRRVVSGWGGQYTVGWSTNPDHVAVYDRAGARVFPESGCFPLQHSPDDDFGIIDFVPPRQVFEAGWGRPVAGGYRITEDSVVFDKHGERVQPTTTTVGRAAHATVPAVRIGQAYVPIADLHRGAWVTGGAITDPGVMPGYNREN